MANHNSVRASSVWPEMPFMRGPDGAQRLREWIPEYREIRVKTAARRERLLRHEWACAQLCQILQLSDARKWSGYIPPARDEHGRLVRSGPRRALIELLRGIAAADQEAEPEFREEAEA